MRLAAVPVANHVLLTRFHTLYYALNKVLVLDNGKVDEVIVRAHRRTLLAPSSTSKPMSLAIELSVSDQFNGYFKVEESL